MYDLLVAASAGEEEVMFPWWKLWWKAIPSKISGFSWKVVRGRLPTKDNLMIRGVSVGLGDGSCSLCRGPVESSNHLLFSCPIALLVWQALSVWLGKSIPFASTAHFAEFVECKKGKVRKKIIGLI